MTTERADGYEQSPEKRSEDRDRLDSGDGESGATTRLHPSAVRMLDRPNNERVRTIIEDKVIIYPAIQHVMNEAKWMILEPRQTRARGLIVCADRGNGKTSLADLIHRKFGDCNRIDHPAVLMISMSGARDARSVYGRIMEALGSPARISHRLSDRELLVQRLLIDVDCRLLILDEVQDILLGSEREQRRALEGIKLLMNELHLPILAFGTDRAGRGFSSDPHLAARFTEHTMPTWKAGDVLADFLATYERLLPLQHPSDLASPDKVALLAKVGEGLIGKIVARVKNAALWAIEDGTERITRDLLIRAISLPGSCVLDDPDEA
jgi:hypothetical protein